MTDIAAAIIMLFACLGTGAITAGVISYRHREVIDRMRALLDATQAELDRERALRIKAYHPGNAAMSERMPTDLREPDK